LQPIAHLFLGRFFGGRAKQILGMIKMLPCASKIFVELLGNYFRDLRITK